MPKSNNPRVRTPRKPRRLSIRSELRDRPDTAKLAGAVIALALAQAEKEAQEQREQQERSR